VFRKACRDEQYEECFGFDFTHGEFFAHLDICCNFMLVVCLWSPVLDTLIADSWLAHQRATNQRNALATPAPDLPCQSQLFVPPTPDAKAGKAV